MVFNLLRQSLLAQNHYWLKWTKKKHGSPQKSFRA